MSSNQTAAYPRLINAVSISRWYDPATDTVHASDGLDQCEPSRLSGFDGPRAFLLEEHTLWGWDRVDPDRLSRPGFLGWFIPRLRDHIKRELDAEGRPLTIIPDLEAVRLNDPRPGVRAERIVYTREILGAIRDEAGPACKIVPYDLPYQDHAGGDEEYLDLLMPAILPHVDAIGCLLYLPSPGQLGVPEFLRQHLDRCRIWAQGKPIEGIAWDGYVSTDAGPMSDGHWADTMHLCAAAQVNTVYLWDSIKRPADFDRIRERVPAIKAIMRRAWVRPAAAGEAA